METNQPTNNVKARDPVGSKKFPKVTGTKDILCMLPKYIVMHGFRPPLDQKMS